MSALVPYTLSSDSEYEEEREMIVDSLNLKQEDFSVVNDESSTKSFNNISIELNENSELICKEYLPGHPISSNIDISDTDIVIKRENETESLLTDNFLKKTALSSIDKFQNYSNFEEVIPDHISVDYEYVLPLDLSCGKFEGSSSKMSSNYSSQSNLTCNIGNEDDNIVQTNYRESIYFSSEDSEASSDDDSDSETPWESDAESSSSSSSFSSPSQDNVVIKAGIGNKNLFAHNFLKKNASQDNDACSSGDQGRLISSIDADQAEVQGQKLIINKRKKGKNKETTFPEDKICLPPIEDLHIRVNEEEAKAIGTVYQIVDNKVVVQSYQCIPAIDLESILFLDRGSRALGHVFDVFGPIHEPLYVVRFNSSDHLKKKDVQIGSVVYFAPKTDYTHYVLLDELMKNRGSDASWKKDKEPPESRLNFSDDEEERRALFERKKSQGKNYENVDARSSSTDSNILSNPFIKVPRPELNERKFMQRSNRSFNAGNFSSVSSSFNNRKDTRRIMRGSRRSTYSNYQQFGAPPYVGAAPSIRYPNHSDFIPFKTRWNTFAETQSRLPSSYELKRFPFSSEILGPPPFISHNSVRPPSILMGSLGPPNFVSSNTSRLSFLPSGPPPSVSTCIAAPFSSLPIPRSIIQSSVSTCVVVPSRPPPLIPTVPLPSVFTDFGIPGPTFPISSGMPPVVSAAFVIPSKPPPPMPSVTPSISNDFRASDFLRSMSNDVISPLPTVPPPSLSIDMPSGPPPSLSIDMPSGPPPSLFTDVVLPGPPLSFSSDIVPLPAPLSSSTDIVTPGPPTSISTYLVSCGNRTDMNIPALSKISDFNSSNATFPSVNPLIFTMPPPQSNKSELAAFIPLISSSESLSHDKVKSVTRIFSPPDTSTLLISSRDQYIPNNSLTESDLKPCTSRSSSSRSVSPVILPTHSTTSSNANSTTTPMQASSPSAPDVMEYSGTPVVSHFASPPPTIPFHFSMPPPQLSNTKTFFTPPPL